MMIDYDDNRPVWYWKEVQQLEQDLADGFMSFTDFNRAMDELDEELLDEPYDPRDMR